MPAQEVPVMHRGRLFQGPRASSGGFGNSVLKFHLKKVARTTF